MIRFALSLLPLGLLVSMPAYAQYGGAGQYPQQESTPNPSAPSRVAPAPNSDSDESEGTPADPAEVWRAAACQAGRDAEPIERLLATPPYSTQELEVAGRTLRIAQRCIRLRDPVATSAVVVRGAMAEALYEARFPQPVTALAPAVGARPLLQPEAVSDPAIVPRVANYHLVAECASRTQQGLIRALLATDRGAPTELPALQALYPVFGTCVPRGTRIALDPAVIRAILAESLYRWSVVQRDGAASPLAAPAAAATPAPAPSAN